MHLKRSLRKDEGRVGGRGGGVGVGVGGGGVGGGGGEQIATGVSKNLSCRFKHCVSFMIIVPYPHHL